MAGPLLSGRSNGYAAFGGSTGRRRSPAGRLRVVLLVAAALAAAGLFMWHQGMLGSRLESGDLSEENRTPDAGAQRADARMDQANSRASQIKRRAADRARARLPQQQEDGGAEDLVDGDGKPSGFLNVFFKTPKRLSEPCRETKPLLKSLLAMLDLGHIPEGPECANVPGGVIHSVLPKDSKVFHTLATAGEDIGIWAEQLQYCGALSFIGRDGTVHFSCEGARDGDVHGVRVQQLCCEEVAR
mmetsp:Transcript_1084/g.2968  ORF Transcript_1084/g.2968 Transcript_1084/m.2968 type:complete len:243 (-) Transcript_1084:426-1154(-)